MKILPIDGKYYPVTEIIAGEPGKYWAAPGISAANCVALAMGKNLDGEIRKMFDQAHAHHRLPDDHKCVHDYLEQAKFYRHRLPRQRPTAEDVVEYMNTHCHDGQIAVVLVEGIYEFRHYCVILPGENLPLGTERSGEGRYELCGFGKWARGKISQLWLYWQDGKDRRAAKYRPPREQTPFFYLPPEDHEAFYFCHNNPEVFTGDCVVRAMVTLFNLNWDEALDEIAAAGKYCTTRINIPGYYEKLLKQQGFLKYPSTVRTHKKIMRGREFCRYLDQTFTHGETVFAELGGTHVAAVMPFREGGRTVYKIVDCFDSSNYEVGGYWVSPRFPEKGEKPRGKLEIGADVYHRRHGAGTLKKTLERKLIIEFGSVGIKTVSREEAETDCIIAGWNRAVFLKTKEEEEDLPF